MLVPYRLRALWGGSTAARPRLRTVIEEQERLLGEYRAECTRALFEGTGIRAGLLRELALYSAGGTGGNGATLQSCIRHASGEWQRTVDPERRSSIGEVHEEALSSC
jgi:hypothetical protein